MIINIKMSDYYNVLELNKDCSDNDIRNAYKKMAVKWHPDKNSKNKEVATKKFKEISEAYKILGDLKKRQLYDKFGKDGIENNNNNNNNNNNYNYTKSNIYEQEILKDLYNINKKRFNKKGPNILYNLNCSIKELFSGCEKKIKIKRKIFNNKKDVIKRELEIITIKVIAGWKDGTKITFKNKADIYTNMKQGNLIITIKEQKNKKINRIENDVIINKEISLMESLIGIDFFITLLNGEKKRIRLKQLYNFNNKHILKNEGMPVRKNGKLIGNGDFIINFNIKFPILNNSDKKKINDILKKY
jgi:DnaJ homolog subfamily B member 4